MRKIYIHRQIESVLKKAAKQFCAVAVTGPRQSGKSTLLKELFSKTHNYVTFDDPIVREQAISDPRLFLDNAGEKVIIDEIQYAPQILSYVKMVIDNNRERKGQFIFTGSQQFVMIKNLGDSLAGRIALLDLLPFSINESRRVPRKTKMLDTTEKCLVDSCLFGSFPELVTAKSINSNAWYGAYLRTYLERDISTTYNIGRLREFQLFVQLLASRCSQELNLSALSNDIGASVNTIKRWVSILQASRIIYLLPPYYQNFGKRITKTPKVYFLDNALACYLLGIKDKETLLKGPMAGALCENFYIQETIKHYFNFGLKPQLYYFRLRNSLEVDLIIEHADRKLSLIEIKLSKTPNKKMTANIGAFKKNFSKLVVKDSRVLCLNDTDMLLAKDVYCQGLDSYLEYLNSHVQ